MYERNLYRRVIDISSEVKIEKQSVKMEVFII